MSIGELLCKNIIILLSIQCCSPRVTQHHVKDNLSVTRGNSNVSEGSCVTRGGAASFKKKV